jgi:cyanate lyase
MPTREAIVEKIQQAKRTRHLTWKTIAEQIGTGSPVLITAALLGQMTLTAEEAAKAATLFSLTEEEAAILTEPPFRGSLPTLPPTDPLLYRFYELLQVYGTSWKALIEEDFGDGIMSAIDFQMAIEREPDSKGDRVKLILSASSFPTSVIEISSAGGRLLRLAWSSHADGASESRSDRRFRIKSTSTVPTSRRRLRSQAAARGFAHAMRDKRQTLWRSRGSSQ